MVDTAAEARCSDGTLGVGAWVRPDGLLLLYQLGDAAMRAAAASDVGSDRDARSSVLTRDCVKIVLPRLEAFVATGRLDVSATGAVAETTAGSALGGGCDRPSAGTAS